MPTDGKLRILQVCSASQAIYGAVQSLMTLARAQKQSGDHVEFVTFKGKQFGAQVRDEGFETHEIRVRAKVDPLAILAMRSLIKRGKFDVVHTHLSTSSVNGCLAARAAGVPSVATVHGMSGKMSFAAATHMIAVSEEIKRHLVGQGAKADQISVVYNGFDFDDVKPERQHQSVFPCLGTVARVTPLKGIEDAIAALSKLVGEFPTASYIVVGDGVGLEPCKALASQLGVSDRVQFVGYRKDIENYLSQMDLFVFPSLKEGMGLALVEAMALGLPVVATNVGGIPEVVSADCGLLVEPKSPDALASSVAEVLRDPARRIAMGKAAEQRARSVFSVSAMLDGTDAVYRRLM